jgi:hypothetical protein
MKTIHRYEVPVDGGWHSFECGPILAVGCRNPEIVEFWAYPNGSGSFGKGMRHFSVVGTGQSFEDVEQYVGTATAPGGQLVWHLIQCWADRDL